MYRKVSADKKKYAKYGALAALVVLLMAGSVAVYFAPNHFSATEANAQASAATSTVKVGITIGGVTVTSNAAGPGGAPWVSGALMANAIILNNGGSTGYLPDYIYINASSFSVDFRVGMRACDLSGSNCHEGWTPWASEVASGKAATKYSALVGTGPYNGQYLSGAPEATLHEGIGRIDFGAETRPLPQGVQINNVVLSLQPVEYDYNAPVDVSTGNSFGPGENPNCDSCNTGYTSGGWSNATYDRWQNANTDGFALGLSANEIALNAAYVSSNIPTSSWNPGEIKTIGTDGQPLEITMKNTGTTDWASAQGAATGTPSGTCQVKVNGSSVNNAPAAQAGNYGKSCTVNYIYYSSVDLLGHMSGAFTVAPDPVKYSRIIAVTTEYLQGETEKVPVFGVCDVTAGTALNNHSTLLSVAYARSVPKCSNPGGTITITDPDHYDYSYSAPADIAQGQTATFILNSLTATTTPGTYPETWQMKNNGAAFGSPAVISIPVGGGGTLNVSSTNIVTGGPVVGSWNVFGPSTELIQNATEKTYAVPLGTYNVIPVGAQGFTLGAVVNRDIAQADGGETVFTKAFNAVRNAFTSAAFADSGLVGADTCVPSNYIFDKSLNRFACKDLKTGTAGDVPAVTLTPSSPAAQFIIMWYPLASMNASPSQVALDGSGNGQISIQNTGAKGSELDWTATTTSAWFSLGSGSGSVVNNGSQDGANGATANLAISIPDPSKLTGSYTGTVNITGTTKYCPADGSLNCSPSVSRTVTFTGTCTGSGCTPCTGPDCNPVSSPTVTITPASSTITIGSSTVLTISSTNATACTESGAWSVATSTCNGTDTETPAIPGTYNYTVKATNGVGGSASALATITVNDTSSKTVGKPSCTLSAKPASILVPASTTLTYACVNVSTAHDACTLSGGGFSKGGPGTFSYLKDATADYKLNGTTADSPTQNTLYVIKCPGVGAYASTYGVGTFTVTVTNPGRVETSTF